MTVKRRKVSAWECHCVRCGHTWTSVAKAKPKRCARCKALDFDKPARAYVRKAR